jgi:hypothetical protein
MVTVRPTKAASCQPRSSAISWAISRWCTAALSGASLSSARAIVSSDIVDLLVFG